MRISEHPEDVDQDAANAERVRDFTEAGALTADYGRGYSDALADQHRARKAMTERRSAARRSLYRNAAKTGAMYGAAYALGVLLGDAVAYLRTGGEPR